MIIYPTKNFSFIYNSLKNEKIRYIIAQGGTRSGKTYAILQNLILYALKNGNKRVHIISVTIPHLRNGAYLDFKKILHENNLLTFFKENKRDLLFTTPNNTQIKFYSADKPEKLRGHQKDIAFINECNLITKEAFQEIDIRTSEKMILDFNPTSKFYLHDFIKNIPSEKWTFLVSTYKDNPFLSEQQIKAIESRKNDPIFWAAYGEGLLSKPTGLILPNFSSGKFIETEKTILGMDFGYTDPTAIVMVAMDGNIVYAKEIIKKPFLSNENILNILMKYKKYKIISDNNEPRLIRYLIDNGMNIVPTKKGKNSVQEGLSIMNSYNLIIDRHSNNLWTELINYKYSNKTNLFTKADDHLIDAMRYAITYLHTMGSRGVLLSSIG